MSRDGFVRRLDVNRAKFEPSRIAPTKAPWTANAILRATPLECVRPRRSQRLRMAPVARFPASLRGYGAAISARSILVPAAQNQQQRLSAIRPRFNLERTEHHEIPRSAPAQRHNFTSTPKPSIGGSTHEVDRAPPAPSAQDVRDPLRVKKQNPRRSPPS